MKEIGIKLKTLRHQNNYKQVHLAQKLQCSIATYCKLETGSTDITYSRLEQLASIYGLELYELFLFSNDHTSELKKLIDNQNTKVSDLVSEIIDLQKKIILLHEELRN